ncbi:protein of unknown function; putative exported protein [Methylorubrum extorquens DM4]|uniref:Transmembrane protein n=1 Tax=Methylorubrum extorquens (strain DSM 6343 / CIP 106787 / DM4) TaxID=661410 RepID=C7CFU9_METED|nr:hypothetical protein [Methylorubrum extorquens]CAX23025.1 protein of unknown function; putative exported protein [Methylorubrum extorquens DM4]
MLRVTLAIAFGSLIVSTAPSVVSAGENGIGYLQRHHYAMPSPPRTARPIEFYRGTPDPFIDMTGSISRRHAKPKVQSGKR